jgi:hypothetical protein
LVKATPSITELSRLAFKNLTSNVKNVFKIEKLKLSHTNNYFGCLFFLKKFFWIFTKQKNLISHVSQIINNVVQETKKN